MSNPNERPHTMTTQDNVWRALRAAGMNPQSLTPQERIEVHRRLYGEPDREAARRSAAAVAGIPLTER